MPNNRNDSFGEQFGVTGADRRGPRFGRESSTGWFDDVRVEKRGLNPEVSKITVRPERPKPIATNQTTSKQPSGD